MRPQCRRNRATLSVDCSFNPTILGFSSFVETTAVQPDGKILIGGSNSGFANANASALKRVLTNGEPDATFAASPDITSVQAIELQSDGKILIGGFFDFCNNIPAYSIVRLNNSSRGNATPFNFDGDGRSDISVFRSANGV